MGLGYALSTSTLFNILLKIFIGGLRPHFLTLCAPAIPPALPGLHGANTIQYYTANQVCTGDAKLVKEAQMTFPSGHASAAFAGFGFLALWVNGRAKVLSRGESARHHASPESNEHHEHRERSEHQEHSEPVGRRAHHKPTSNRRVHHYKLFLFVLPWCIAAILALSKLRDAWHHPIDILFGALIGMAFAHMAYKMCYWSVYDERTNHIPLGGVSGERVGEGERGKRE